MPIKFTQDAIKKYLDTQIRFYRKEHQKHISKRKDFMSINVVQGTINAYQAVRVSLFGRKLK